MALQVFDRIEDFARLEADWGRLAHQELRSFPLFVDVYSEISERQAPFRVIVAGNEGRLEAIACVLLDRPRLDFFNKPKRSRLLNRQAELLGAAILGAPDARLAAAMLDRILGDPKISYIKLGDIERASGLYTAVRQRRWQWLRLETDWLATRRLIRFPASFKAYLGAMRTSTQRAIRRELRKFAVLNAEIRIMTRPEDMRKFSDDASSVAAKIPGSDFYLGNHVARAHRLRRFEAKARAGKMFGLVAYAGGKPIAYKCGEIAHDVFSSTFIAFDPAYRKFSAGTATLAYAIEYLIENRICARFDFNGRDMEYKVRFANTALDCTNIAMGSLAHPRAALAILLGRASAVVKPRLFGLLGGRTGVREFKATIRAWGKRTNPPLPKS